MLCASKLVLSGSWSTTASVGSAGSAPIIAVRPGIAEVSAAESFINSKRGAISSSPRTRLDQVRGEAAPDAD